MKIIIATQNPHKVEEIREIAKLFGYTNFDFQPIDKNLNFAPIEDGETFEANSLIKAKEANRLTKSYTLADDSGLCVDFLDGAPGIYSARYAETPQKRIDKLLEALKSAINRKAKFVCALTLINPSGEIEFSTRGECLGEISKTQSGGNGFGYDPIFLVGDSRKTMADLSEAEKNRLSHRSLAIQKLLRYLSEKNPV